MEPEDVVEFEPVPAETDDRALILATSGIALIVFVAMGIAGVVGSCIPEDTKQDVVSVDLYELSGPQMPPGVEKEQLMRAIAQDENYIPPCSGPERELWEKHWREEEAHGKAVVQEGQGPRGDLDRRAGGDREVSRTGVD